jgi:protein-L-isoaspartate(D-aspartate) O-methyltransferase
MAKVTEDKLDLARASLLAELAGTIHDSRVLGAMSRLPRERFVPPEARYAAYANHPLPIGYGQTISQPLIAALMTQALLLTGGERVLEVGTGSGYQTALLSLLADRVVSVERVGPRAQRAI